MLARHLSGISTSAAFIVVAGCSATFSATEATRSDELGLPDAPLVGANTLDASGTVAGTGEAAGGDDAWTESDDEVPPPVPVTCVTASPDVLVGDAGVATSDAGTGTGSCAAPPTCNSTPQTFQKSMSLKSGKHHAGPSNHVSRNRWNPDSIESCPDDDCRGSFQHGRSSTVQWQAYCVPAPAGNANACIAKVKIVDPFLVSATNVEGAYTHVHTLTPGYSCAFVGDGSVKEVVDCVLGGAEDVELASPMTQYGDGVTYGIGYAANHDNSTLPTIGITAGYNGAGAFVTINNTTAATYKKAIAWAQGMTCDADGNPRLLSNDGNGHDYPMASSIQGNE